MRKKIQEHRKEIGYFFKNAPLAIMTSSLPGFVNYAIILFLTAFGTMEDVGQYRLLMSYYALIGLFSFQETSKILIRAQASGDKKTSAALFFFRLYGMVLATFGVALLWGIGTWLDKTIVPDGLLCVALLGCLTYPTELFFSYLQGERRFPLLAGMTALKFASALIVFVALVVLEKPVWIATMIQLAIMAMFNIVFFSIWLGADALKFARFVANPIRLFRRARVREGVGLSLSNWLPNTLEHFDKMVIGYLFGLEILGLYTLAFSTGRFIYNALKPAFYIYYRHFVEKLPTKKLLNLVMFFFTFFGLCFSVVFALGLHFLPAFSKFSGGEAVVYILFLSYGIAMVDAINCHSYGLNKETRSHHLLISNTAISLICLCLIASSAFVSAPLAMILCAAHFPINHAGSLFFLSLLKRTSIKA